jgi:predicted nuclease of predicted toxin-antitoxin system
MKVLLDECITKKLKPYLKDLEVYTVSEMGWSGFKNGKLISLCVMNHFDILLTIDKNMLYQQNVENHPITIVVLESLTSKLEELKLFIPSFLQPIHHFEKNRAYVIENL